MDFSWKIDPSRERECYKHSTIHQKIAITTLPKSATQFLAWFTALVAMLTAADMTTTDILTK